MHAILAVDPADPPAPPVRDAFYHAAQRHRGKVMHIVMFNAPDDDEYGAALRDTLAFLKVTKFPTYLISDMTGADDEHPGGAQTHFRGDLQDKDAVLAFKNPSEKALARRDGLDVKYAGSSGTRSSRRCSATSGWRRSSRSWACPKGSSTRRAWPTSFRTVISVL